MPKGGPPKVDKTMDITRITPPGDYIVTVAPFVESMFRSSAFFSTTDLPVLGDHHVGSCRVCQIKLYFTMMHLLRPSPWLKVPSVLVSDPFR